ncbi:MAG: MFS transporter [Myxococcales bacterium]|nr:MFS transporter [Myxococcales bacterium]
MGGLLGVYGKKRVLVFVTLGIASGLPYDLLRGTLSLWLADAGVDIETIGAFALIALVFNFKLLWAPALDRYTPGFLGRRRGWMLMAQLGLIAAIFAMGLVGPEQSLTPLIIITLVVAFLSASHDIVVDAFRTDILAPSERGAGAATYTFGFRVAMILGGGLAVVLSDYMSWGSIYMLMSGLMAIGVVSTFIAPAPSESIPTPNSLLEAVVDPLRDFFGRYGWKGATAILFFLLFFKFGEGLASQLLNPFLGSKKGGGLGFSGTELGTVRKFVGMTAAILGAFAGGSVISRWGTFRPLLVCGILQSLANLGYLVLALTGKSIVGLGLAISLDQFLGGMATTAFVAFLMSICNKRYSAFQFALFTSASTLMAHSLGALSGVLQASVGWPLFFATTIVVAVPALLVLALAMPQITTGSAD